MMRSRSKALPLFGLLGIEIVVIVGLQALGSNSQMQIPWGNLSTWFSTSTIDQLLPPIVRLAALALAYWMFVSTALSVIAQVSRIPGAIRATSMFTLPSVRRMVDSAMIVSVAATSVVGMTGTAAFADTNSSGAVPSSGDITTSIAATPGDLSVPTPTVGADDSTTTSSTALDDTTTTAAPDTTTSTTAAPATTTSTTAAPAATTDTTALAPTAGSDWVPTPEPGAALPATTTTSTTMPQGPSTPATNATTPAPAATTPAPATSGTQVLGETDHRVVAGENLWTISRDALASSSGQPASSISEAQIRDYWLKVIDANRDNLRSKDPHWIFPGEVISLPTQDTASAN